METGLNKNIASEENFTASQKQVDIVSRLHLSGKRVTAKFALTTHKACFNQSQSLL